MTHYSAKLEHTVDEKTVSIYASAIVPDGVHITTEQLSSLSSAVGFALSSNVEALHRVVEDRAVEEHGHTAAVLDGVQYERECDCPSPQEELDRLRAQVDEAHDAAQAKRGFTVKVGQGGVLHPKDEETYGIPEKFAGNHEDDGMVKAETVTVSADRLSELVDYERKVKAAGEVPWYGSAADRLAAIRLQLWGIPMERTLKELAYYDRDR